MTRNDWTEIVCILDRSGSMASLAAETIEGLNAFVNQQKKLAGRARISLVLFDDRVEPVWKHFDVTSAPELDGRTYFARGSTALLDALGRTIEGTRTRIEGMHHAERPEDVIVLVMTDGYENASVEFDLRTVRAMIEHRQAEGWEFVFIGADVAAGDIASTLGMADGSASQVTWSRAGAHELYSKMNRSVSNRRQKKSRVDVDAPLAPDDWL